MTGFRNPRIQPTMEEMTSEERRVCVDALRHYMDSRMKIARRRDRQEKHLTGVSIEKTLEPFFELCRNATRKLQG